jgi:hypothetical protein
MIDVSPKIPDKTLDDHMQNEPPLRGEDGTASLRGSESGYESDDEDKNSMQEHTAGRR